MARSFRKNRVFSIIGETESRRTDAELNNFSIRASSARIGLACSDVNGLFTVAPSLIRIHMQLKPDVKNRNDESNFVIR